MRTRTIVVTGASGMIGRHLCDRFRREGWMVRAMMRDTDAYPFHEPGIERVRIDLPRHVDDAAFRGADAVVHAAYATRGGPDGDARRTNEGGASRVIAAAKTAGARIVFVSSFSAGTTATSYYAQSKRAVEAMLDSRKDLVVRAGLVLAADGGMARRLWAAIARFHVAPVFDGGRQVVQTIHIHDLCDAFVRAIAMDVSGLTHVAEADGLPMRDLLHEMATAIGVRCAMLPVPARPLVAALRVLEWCGVRAPMASDNVLGLLALQRIDTSGDLQRLGVHARPARASIADIAPLVRRR